MFSRLARNVRSLRTTQIRSSLATRGFSMDTAGGFTYPAPRNLDGVVNMELFLPQSPENMEIIWTEHHAQSSTSMGMVISDEDYDKMTKRASHCSYFTLPVMKGQGHFVLLSQFQGNSILFTYLEDYIKNPSIAAPYLTVTFYPELSLTKKLVFVRVDVCALATLTKADCDRLMRQIVQCYRDDELYKIVYDFNKNPRTFDFEAAMPQLNAIQ